MYERRAQHPGANLWQRGLIFYRLLCNRCRCGNFSTLFKESKAMFHAPVDDYKDDNGQLPAVVLITNHTHTTSDVLAAL